MKGLCAMLGQFIYISILYVGKVGSLVIILYDNAIIWFERFNIMLMQLRLVWQINHIILNTEN